ncbi:MAG: DEAD/DEAH box helicase [Deltaproteobacteria bacterium]|nr:DEAD/DEAH box helicase [Deltaproteobacteria bacterium]
MSETPATESTPSTIAPDAAAPATAPSDYIATKTFAELPLSEDLRKGIADKGYIAPTPVQAAVLEPILAGKDLIVRSKTGTGKTAAFGIPMLERIPAGTREVSGVILCNTRELALQVAQELTALAKHKDLSVIAIYGGASMDQQNDALARGAEIVVGTPGRVMDLQRRGTLKFGGVKMVVLDEADEMLGAGFFEDVTHLLDLMPKERQTLLFSATVPPDIAQLVERYLNKPETILLSGDVFTVDHIKNVIFHLVDSYPKPRNLLYLIEREDPESAIIFCNTRTDTELIANVLNRHGFDAEMLNGDLAQGQRERVMAKIKKGELRFMVATDLAARGIDISDLSHVINYSLPEDPAVYMHRVGRTGRIGKKGTAMSLVSGAEIMTLSALEKKYNVKFETRTLPTPEEARALWTGKHIKELRDAMTGGVAFEAMLPLAQDLSARDDGNMLIAYALKYFFTHHRMERAQQRAAGEKHLEPLATGASEVAPAKKHEKREKRGEKRDGERGRREREGREGSGREGGSREAGGREGGSREGGRRERGGKSDRERFESHQAGQAAGAGSAAGASSDATGGAAAQGAASGADASGTAAPAAPAAPIDRVKLFVTQGREEGWEGGALADALSTLAGQARDTVLAVDLYGRHSYVLVKPEAHAEYLAKSGQTLKDKAVTIEIARPRKR